MIHTRLLNAQCDLILSWPLPDHWPYCAYEKRIASRLCANTGIIIEK